MPILKTVSQPSDGPFGKMILCFFVSDVVEVPWMR